MKRYAKWLALPLFVACLACDCESEEEDSGTVTFFNETSFFIHVLYEDNSVLYVPPGRAANLTVDFGDASVVAVVAPGQGVESTTEVRPDCCETDSGQILCGGISAHWSDGDLSLTADDVSCYSDTGSCPFVLGAEGGLPLALKGEVLTGAVFEGARRTDTLRLGEIDPTSSTYEARLRTVLREVDHIDQAELIVVDHAAGVLIAPNEASGIRAFLQPATPYRVTDSSGKEITSALVKADGRIWSGRLDGPEVESAARDYAIVEFAKPVDATQARFLLRARNTPTVEQSLLEFLYGLGPGFRVFRRSASLAPGYEDSLNHMFRRAGLALEITVERDGRWETAAWVAPFGAASQREKAFDITELPRGEQLRIKMRGLPRGWEVDQLLVDYSRESDLSYDLHRLRPSRATASGRGDVSALLAATDQEYVDRRRGDAIDLSFDLPEPRGERRTVLLQVNGYYDMPTPCELRTDLLRIYHWWRGESGFRHYALWRAEQAEQKDARR